ncbi:hypothetical protein GCM10009560_76210 [Nonomuraea longicatena]|uniref:Uncharacterized protein n=1 Tax=Nonomuraea longicatena TaxID=83682 RepID=A0ABP4BQX3_9ACTN
MVSRSHTVNIQTGVWAWPLDEIAATAPVDTLVIVPNGMEVALASDERVRFVVNKRRAWMEAIAQAKG